MTKRKPSKRLKVAKAIRKAAAGSLSLRLIPWHKLKQYSRDHYLVVADAAIKAGA